MTDRPQSTDALYSDRIRLLQNDPNRYFQEYPRLKFGFQPSVSASQAESENRRNRR